MGVFPECDAQWLIAVEQVKLLERKIVKQQNGMGVLGLIQWSNGSEEDATWEDLADLTKRFPAFVLDLEVKDLWKRNELLYAEIRNACAEHVLKVRTQKKQHCVAYQTRDRCRTCQPTWQKESYVEW
nr:F-box domain, FBD domain, leucine-rich repeat domain, L domain-like protein [Tanacetum cinerariifolium]